eukprot:757120-Hanusia_phi.AAC.4
MSCHSVSQEELPRHQTCMAVGSFLRTSAEASMRATAAACSAPSSCPALSTMRSLVPPTLRDSYRRRPALVVQPRSR